MTVAELINRLQQYPSDLTIAIYDQNDQDIIPAREVTPLIFSLTRKVKIKLLVLAAKTLAPEDFQNPEWVHWTKRVVSVTEADEKSS